MQILRKSLNFFWINFSRINYINLNKKTGQNYRNELWSIDFMVYWISYMYVLIIYPKNYSYLWGSSQVRGFSVHSAWEDGNREVSKLFSLFFIFFHLYLYHFRSTSQSVIIVDLLTLTAKFPLTACQSHHLP